jgi:hypothetical protein
MGNTTKRGGRETYFRRINQGTHRKARKHRRLDARMLERAMRVLRASTGDRDAVPLGR